MNFDYSRGIYFFAGSTIKRKSSSNSSLSPYIVGIELSLGFSMIWAFCILNYNNNNVFLLLLKNLNHVKKKLKKAEIQGRLLAQR